MSPKLWTLALWAMAVPLLVVSEGLTVSVQPLGSECLMGCFDALTLLLYSDIPATAGYYDGYCGSTEFTTSLVLCAKTYCSSLQQLKGWELVTGYCTEYGETAIADMASIEQLIDYNNITNVDALDSQGITVNGTVLVDEVSFKAGLRTENVWDREMIFHHAFGWSMYLLLGIALLAGISNRLLSIYRTRTGLAASARGIDWSEIAPEDTKISRAYACYRRYIGVPALFGYKHAQSSAWFSLPTRLQALLIFAYVAINVIFCCVNYDAFYNNLYWYGEVPVQIWRYIADRTAIMSFYNLPLLWCLAGRNDLILWLTGWSFASVNIFHRWVARVTVLQAVVHSIAWTWEERKYIPLMWAEMYWRTGVFATVTMCLLLPFSIKPLREKWYEVFLITHIVLALASLILLFYHVTVYDGEYNPYLWACVAVWCLDRFCRVVRAILLSYTAARGNNAVAKATGGASGLVRLSVRTSIRIAPRPGQHYYLYTPMSLTPWENHPFTVASWDKSDAGVTLNFLVDTKAGATRRLRRKLTKSGDHSASLRVLLEGPYGHTAPLEQFEHVLLVAGGSGITALLPYLFDLRQRASVSPKRCVTRQIYLVWAVKREDYAADVMNHELAEFAEISGMTVNVKCYLTAEALSPQQASPSVPSLEYHTANGETVTLAPSSHAAEGSIEHKYRDGSSEKGSSLVKTNKHVYGRPEMGELLRSNLDTLIGCEKLAVLACGPAGMMDDMRQVVSQSYGHGEGQINGSSLEYFEESFTW